jgi:hypothetical protein
VDISLVDRFTNNLWTCTVSTADLALPKTTYCFREGANLSEMPEYEAFRAHSKKYSRNEGKNYSATRDLETHLPVKWY